MNSFEKLLNTVRSNNPNLISEQDATAMLADYNTSIDQMKSDAQAIGWQEGYKEGKEVAAAEAKKNLDELLEKCDKEATEKLNAVISTLNQDHATKLQEVYDNLMDNMVPASELEEMDKDYADKFEEALRLKDETDAKKFEEAMKLKDETDAKKLKLACESIMRKSVKFINEREEFNGNKFNAYKTIAEEKINKAKKELDDEKSKKLNLLAEGVEKYLNYALQNAIPSKQLISEAKYNASQKAIEKITSILKINNILQESKDGIFKDYEDKISAVKSESNRLLNENVELKNTLRKQEAQLVLESKLLKATPAEASFLRNYFKDAVSKQIIEEQIEDAKNAFKRIHEQKRAEMEEKVAKSSPSRTLVVNESKAVNKQEPAAKKVVTESVDNKKESFASIYASILKNDNN